MMRIEVIAATISKLQLMHQFVLQCLIEKEQEAFLSFCCEVDVALFFTYMYVY